MAKSELGKGFKEKLQGAVGSAVTAAKEVRMPDVKAKVSDMKGAFKKKPTAEAETDHSDTLEIKSISTKSALKIIYYLMAADGEIFHSEEEKFDSIGKELDPNFADSKEQIVKECQAQLDKVIDPEDYYDALQDGIEDALLASRQTADTFVTPKLLVWDMLILIPNKMQTADK